MLFTLRRPQSERFFQLNFHGFKPRGRTVLHRYTKTVFLYFKALVTYLFRKIRFFVYTVVNLVRTASRSIYWLKSFVVRKLIWSRGRLGRPVATFVVMSVAFGVFLLNSSKFVNSQEIDKDYLAYTTDIIPQKNTTITQLPPDRQRTEPLSYTVQEGDTLYSIGNQFKISVDALRYVNNLSDISYLKVGQAIVIPPVAGLVHKVGSGDTLQAIANKYDVPSQAIADFNYILDTSKLAVGTELIIPGAKVPQPVVAIVPSQFVPQTSVDFAASKGWCGWPTSVRIVTQYFSWYHNGLDIATPWGFMPPIYACAGGTVIRAGWDPWGLGLHIRIDHGNGYVTIYGHMSRLDVSYGEEVSKGEVVGLMGSTGRSTGPHVHFMVQKNGVSQNPLNYIN